MEHIKTIVIGDLGSCADKRGCGECQTPCQSFGKTSNTSAHQKCVNEDRLNVKKAEADVT